MSYTSKQLTADIASLQAGFKSLQDEMDRLDKCLLWHQDVGRLVDILQQVVTYDEPNRRWLIYASNLAFLCRKDKDTLLEVLPK